MYVMASLHCSLPACTVSRSLTSAEGCVTLFSTISMSPKAKISLAIEVGLISLWEVRSPCSCPSFLLCCFAIRVTHLLLGLGLTLCDLGRNVIGSLLP